MSIYKIVSREVVRVYKTDSIYEATKLMKENNVGDVIVVNKESNTPIGILTDRDIVIKIVFDEVNPRDVCVADLMSSNLLILEKHQSINECVEMMCAKGVRRAPIVDENNKLCGIATIDDLIILLADELSSLAKLVRKQTAHH
ncbi:MAG: histidine kinase [Gammaproteobacteria bacterium]|jgi:CBS domain-containing protein|nr:histidine kinase [Gammaproteobacteria bacterium]